MPLSTPVPMPPSMSGSEELVIWMPSTAISAPSMQPNTEIQQRKLARSGA